MKTGRLIGLGLVIAILVGVIAVPMGGWNSFQVYFSGQMMTPDEGEVEFPAVDSPSVAEQAVEQEIESAPEVVQEPATEAVIESEAQAPQQVEQQAAPNAAAGSILANRRVLTFYGHPYDARMGILGELSNEDLVAALQRRAEMYEALSDRPVQPAIHFISTVAQGSPGEDGLYRARTDSDIIQRYANLAERNGMLFFIDIQVGRSSVQQEIEAMMEFLVQPNIHLALDPEFDMWGGQVPGEQIGSMGADEINYAQGVLSNIVQEHGGPNKILIVHQFTPDMITGKGAIVDDLNVDLVTDMDGFGTPELKIKHYDMFVRDELLEYAGIKLFFTQDTPLMSPEEIMALEPTPDVIIYQ